MGDYFMNNAIVYSLHISDDIQYNLNIRQFQYSIDTLLKYNNSIPIKVYLSPYTLINSNYVLPKHSNIEYIYFNADADSRLDDKVLATWTSHKWQVSFHALKNFNLDNVLYLDMDTYFQNDPKYLFDLYGNTEYIYSKITNFGKEYIDLFKIKSGMNDGTNLISKKILKHADNIVEERIKYVHKFQEELKSMSNIKDFEKKMSWIQWVACQFGVSEYMKSIDKEIKTFEINDVALISETNLLNNPENICIIHYFNYNTPHILPKQYWNGINLDTFFLNKQDWSN